jgi:dTDP-4-amino-4,6-dideoxy-D-galactose acyltransferase
MIRRLAWESEFFGFDIAQLELEGPAPDLTAVDRFLASHRAALVQAIVPISEINLANLLEANGFYLADIRVSFRIEVAAEPRAAPSARVASRDDIAELRELAAELFVDSRFFHPVFALDDSCLVLAVTAFITLRHRADNPVIIGLIGVRKSEQHTGAGSEIMDARSARGAKSIDVSTQGKNLAAQNLYITKGGRLRQMAAWFYRHSPTGDNR